MKTNELTLLLQIAGALHIGLLCAGILMPQVVGIRGSLAGLPVFIRRLFWVYYGFIGFCILSFGLLTWTFAETLGSGSPLPRAICIFLAMFWFARLGVAVFVFDVRPYLKDRLSSVGYHALNFVFGLLPLIYVLAAIGGVE